AVQRTARIHASGWETDPLMLCRSILSYVQNNPTDDCGRLSACCLSARGRVTLVRWSPDCVAKLENAVSAKFSRNCAHRQLRLATPSQCGLGGRRLNLSEFRWAPRVRKHRTLQRPLESWLSPTSASFATQSSRKQSLWSSERTSYGQSS